MTKSRARRNDSRAGFNGTTFRGARSLNRMIFTLAAGLLGIAVSVGILAGVELAMTRDGILRAAFQVPFWTAVAAALLLTVLGVLAGLAPSLRAMKIKPVDAMRDE